MELSRHNIISSIGSNHYFIVNLLSQQADILSAHDYHQLISGNYENKSELIEKGYLTDPENEKKEYQRKYLEFLDKRQKDEIQLFYVPAYTCNFACSYCYQDQYKNKITFPDKKVAEAFFQFVDLHFGGRRKYITLFGGEPLLNSKNHKEFLEWFFNLSAAKNLEIAVVTNGYHIIEYLDLLKSGITREVQVTLDGIEGTHDARRPLKDGRGTFSRIAEGVSLLLDNNIQVNLRMVLDKTNINELPEMAKFASENGWTRSAKFKTQLGRNYELHHCHQNPDMLYSRIGLYRDISKLLKEHPYILDFHKPAFSVSRFLFEEGNLPDPLFDSCPGMKTEFAFDYSGRIYACTATVGKAGEDLGSFYPEVRLDEEKIFQWENRDVVGIPECASCNLQLACGGGCGAVAKNMKGTLLAPDCRPVKELLELGFAQYFDDKMNA